MKSSRLICLASTSKCLAETTMSNTGPSKLFGMPCYLMFGSSCRPTKCCMTPLHMLLLKWTRSHCSFSTKVRPELYIQKSLDALIAHNCTRKHPAHRIMSNFYAPNFLESGHGKVQLPRVLGLTASPVQKAHVSSVALQ